MMETYRGVAHPWLCDAMGHLNTRHYLAMFDDALHHYVSCCGHSFGNSARGFADVSISLVLRSEVKPGSLLTIRSETLKIGRTSLSSRHWMTDAENGEARAVCEIVSVYLDMVERQPTPLTATIVAAARSLLPDVQATEAGGPR
jgi:acyl-CoA thioester hydrolase